jgi:hypothetical protein
MPESNAMVSHTALVGRGASHTVFIGRLVSLDGLTRTPVHLWIELEDGNLIDFRARMWLGDDGDVPHGLFTRETFPSWKYAGEDIEIAVLSPALVTALLQLNGPR